MLNFLVSQHKYIRYWLKKMLTIKQHKCADLAAQKFDLLSHFQVIIKENLFKKKHKYMCNQRKNTTLSSTSVTDLLSPPAAFLSFTFL